MATCAVYHCGLLLGTGSVTQNATSITGFTVTSGGVVGTGRNIQLMITSSSDSGAVSTGHRVTLDGGTTLTIAPANPWRT